MCCLPSVRKAAIQQVTRSSVNFGSYAQDIRVNSKLRCAIQHRMCHSDQILPKDNAPSTIRMFAVSGSPLWIASNI